MRWRLTRRLLGKLMKRGDRDTFSHDMFEHEHIWHSKYGNLRRILRLDKGNLDRMASRMGSSLGDGSGNGDGGGPPLGEIKSGGTATVSGSGSGAKNILLRIPQRSSSH